MMERQTLLDRLPLSRLAGEEFMLISRAGSQMTSGAGRAEVGKSVFEATRKSRQLPVGSKLVYV